jgi:hypothetical protein
MGRLGVLIRLLKIEPLAGLLHKPGRVVPCLPNGLATVHGPNTPIRVGLAWT